MSKRKYTDYDSRNNNWRREGHNLPMRNNHKYARWEHEVQDEAFKGLSWVVWSFVFAVFTAVAVVLFIK